MNFLNLLFTPLNIQCGMKELMVIKRLISKRNMKETTTRRYYHNSYQRIEFNFDRSAGQKILHISEISNLVTDWGSPIKLIPVVRESIP